MLKGSIPHLSWARHRPSSGKIGVSHAISITIALMDTEAGRIKLELYDDDVTRSLANGVKDAKEGFDDGLNCVCLVPCCPGPLNGPQAIFWPDGLPRYSLDTVLQLMSWSGLKSVKIEVLL